MKIHPGHVAVLNHFNATPIAHTIDAFVWGDLVADLVEQGMLDADKQRRSFTINDKGRSLLRILQQQRGKEMEKLEEEQAKKKAAAQPQIDVITELVKTMGADERLLLFRHLERSFCFTSGANR